MLTYEKVRDVVLDSLRSRGYSPNAADVQQLATRIMDLSKAPDPPSKAEKVEEDEGKPSRK